MHVPVVGIACRTLALVLGSAFLFALAVAAEARASSGTMLITSSTALTEDHQGSIVIANDGVTLDCAGHAVSGPGSFGIALSGRRGVTVQNCVVGGFNQDIILTDSSANTVTGNRVRGAVFQGIALFGSSDNRLARNVASDNSPGAQGILVFGNSDRNVVAENTASRNLQGLQVDAGSDGNELARNIANDNAVFGFSVGGGSAGNVIDRNVFVGNQVFGGFVFNAAGTVIRRNVVASSRQLGIAMNGVTSTLVSGNEFVGNGDAGLQLFLSSGNEVRSNRFLRNAGDGLDLNTSNSNRVLENRAEGNASSGFVVQSSNRNLLKENSAFGNGTVGFYVFDASALNLFTENVACANKLDALDASVGLGNGWDENRFCTASGITQTEED